VKTPRCRTAEHAENPKENLKSDPCWLRSLGARGGAVPVRAYNVRIMLSKDLLDILVCPDCKQPLEYRQNPENLKCTHCHRVYRVEDNIPIMLIDEATIEP